MTVRLFRPSIVVAVPGGWLAVDEQQPVAVELDPTGRHRNTVSWNRLPAPTQFGWPRREVAVAGGSVWVHDRPDGPTVRIARTPAAGLDATAEPLPPRAAGEVRAYTRFALSGEPGGAGWRVRSELDGYRWTASVERGDQVWSLGERSITSCAVSGATAAVCLRRAPKRPWAFRPHHQLVLLEEGVPPVDALPDGLDVGEMSWPAPSSADVDRALADYLPFTVAECRQAVAAGATDVRFEVADLDGLPTITTTFGWGPDGTRFVRVDEPLDEVGRLVGYRALGIVLDEDLRGSDLLRHRGAGTVRV
jgi:hypothetical protein